MAHKKDPRPNRVYPHANSTTWVGQMVYSHRTATKSVGPEMFDPRRKYYLVMEIINDAFIVVDRLKEEPETTRNDQWLIYPM